MHLNWSENFSFAIFFRVLRGHKRIRSGDIGNGALPFVLFLISHLAGCARLIGEAWIIVG